MTERLELLTPKEVAKILRVSPRTVQRWVKAGKLRAVRAGRLWRIPKEALVEFLSEKSEAGVQRRKEVKG